jgi:hypothetical protein
MKRFGKRRRTFDALLAVDANRVIGLRIAKLMLGGKSAQREAKLMVTEKMAAASATTSFVCIGGALRRTRNASAGSNRPPRPSGADASRLD